MPIDPQLAANSLGVMYPTDPIVGDDSATPVLLPISVWAAALVELRVVSNLLNADCANIDLNQMRADEL